MFSTNVYANDRKIPFWLVDIQAPPPSLFPKYATLSSFVILFFLSHFINLNVFQFPQAFTWVLSHVFEQCGYSKQSPHSTKSIEMLNWMKKKKISDIKWYNMQNVVPIGYPMDTFAAQHIPINFIFFFVPFFFFVPLLCGCCCWCCWYMIRS